MKPFLRTSFSVIVAFFFVAPSALFAATLSAGVPMDPIWFSKDPFFEGDQITIFTPLYNSSAYRFSGTVELHDGTGTIGAKQFTLDPKGASEIFAFSWKAERGEHTFSIAIVNGKFIGSGKTLVDLPISAGTTGVVKRSVIPKQETSASVPKTPTADNVTYREEARYLNTKIPESALRNVLPIVESVEAFRVNQATRANTMRNEIVAELSPGGVLSDSGVWGIFTEGALAGDIIRTPWEYVKLFFALGYQFLTANIYAFYILCSYILYRVIRFVIAIFI